MTAGTPSWRIRPTIRPLVLNALKREGLTLRAILLTHLHFDHASGCAALSEAVGLPVYVGAEDWEMKDTLLSRGMRFGLPEVPAFKGEILAPGSYVWGDMECRAIHAPGHSAGSLCSTFRKKRLCLRGTCYLPFRRALRLSRRGCGYPVPYVARTHYTLPSDTVVYPGHGPVTTVGDEAAHNPFCSI